MQTSRGATAGFIATAVLSVLTCACGAKPESASPDGGPADGGPLLTLGGTFNALTLNPVDGVGFINTSMPRGAANAGVKSELIVVISDKSNLCGTGIARQNETAFSIDAVSGSSTFQPGTYTELLQEVPGQVDVNITKFNAACSTNNQDFGTASGSVVITSVTSTAVAGSFNVTLDADAGTLQGSFNVPLCQSPPTNCAP